MNENRQIYESKRVVQNYKEKTKLFPAENILLDLVLARKENKSMLDLGVGTGRTTGFFAKHFGNYLGIDISSQMIEVCKQRFTGAENTEFIISDAASLPQLPRKEFDFIFFSFNGIDCLKNLDERIALLGTIHGLLSENGLFAFSSHNTLAVYRLYSFQLPRRNPFKLITEYYHYVKLREVNGPISNFTNKNFFQIYDGCEYFKAKYGYILPSFQINLLAQSGFKNIQAIDIKGENIPLSEVDSCNDNWIHYFCYKN